MCGRSSVRERQTDEKPKNKPRASIRNLLLEDIYFKTVFLWNPTGGELYTTLPGHASLDGTILLWDLAASLGR
ncbi:MAG: hypothetical protein A3K46_08515 [Chloroflexi bacterium RBG_13_60_9]|nr:MAG: hypothetical protein A3K46_08515 [Chloroflexi bacterium RBG_13_60_9]